MEIVLEVGKVLLGYRGWSMVYMIIAIDSLVSKSKHVIAIHGRSL